MLAILGLLAVILLGLVITRVATVVLTLTGMSQESARFQARSALTGVGFTTSEAEAVVAHPVRRRVVMTLMLIGSAGVITVVTTLMLSFVNSEGRTTVSRMLLLLGGLVVLFALARSPLVDRGLSRLIRRALARWTDLDVRDYAALLHVAHAYTIMEVFVEDDDWTAGRRLDELELPKEGLRVLGVEKPDGRYLGAPQGWTVVEPADKLVLYGLADAIGRIDRRKAGPDGDAEHARCIVEQAEIERREGAA